MYILIFVFVFFFLSKFLYFLNVKANIVIYLQSVKEKYIGEKETNIAALVWLVNAST